VSISTDMLLYTEVAGHEKIALHVIGHSCIPIQKHDHSFETIVSKKNLETKVSKLNYSFETIDSDQRIIL
jgi:hypothetical protein